MKIAFAIDDTLDVADGVQQAVLTIGRQLSSMGHSVYYLTSDTKRNDIGNVYSLSKNIRVAFNGNTLRIPTPANSKKIKRILEDEKFDVIHIQMPYSPFLVAKIIHNAPSTTKIVGTFHILPYRTINKFATYLLGLILSSSIKKIKHVVSVSEPARQFCNETFKVDSIVIPNPVNLKDYKKVISPTSNDRKRIVFLGRLVKRKGPKELIDAYGELLKNNSNLIEATSLLIAGTGVEELKLRKMITRLPKKSSVEFLGYIKENEKPGLLSSADIAVFPSLSGESFGIVLIEAMAAGAKQVLAGDNPGYRSVMKDFPRLLINPKNKKEFADRLFDLLQDNEVNRKQSLDLSKHVEKYDVANVCGSLINLYKS